MKKVIAVAVAMAAAGSANAAWIPGSGFSSTDGELILTVWDGAAEVAFSQDLGILTSDALKGNIADGTTIQLSTAGLSHIGSFSNLSWNIAGASYDIGSTYDPATTRFNSGIYMTLRGAMPTAPKDVFGFLPGLMDNYFAPYGTFVNQTAGVDPVHLSSGDLAHAGEGSIWGDGLGGLTNNIPDLVGTSGVNGATLEAIAYTGTYDDPANGIYTNIIESEGFWTLDAAAGTLVYTAPSAVPVPAAAWLFGSALVGLAGVARRRKA